MDRSCVRQGLGKLESVIRIIIYFGMCILPLLGYTGHFESVKIQGVYILSAVSVVGILLLREKQFVLTKSDILYGLWVIVLGISSAVSSSPVGAFAGWFGRGQGVIFFIGVWTLSFYLRHVLDRGNVLFSRLFLYVYISEIIIMIAQYVFPSLLGIWVPLLEHRVTGTFGEPNTAGAFCVLSLPLVDRILQKTVYRNVVFLRFTVFFASFIALVLTGSRIALLCWCIAFVCMVTTVWKRKIIRYILFTIVCIGVIGTIAYISFIRGSSPVENRMTLWKYAVKAIMQKPIFGYGAESNELVYDKAFLSDEIITSPLVIDRTHNLFLDIAVWSGVMGLGIWIGFLVLLLFHRNLSIEHLGIGLFLLFASFQPVGAAIWLLFTVYWGLLVAQERKNS